jgi:hypothetical protein
MKKLLFLSMLLLTACGNQQGFQTAKDPRDVTGIDPKFQGYVDMYVGVKGSPLNYDIPIGFAPQNGNVIGMCTRWSNGYRQIEVDPTYWNDPTTTENERIALIFHELGHCDLNRDHDTTLLSSGYPESLMYPYDVGFLSSMQTYYFHELFHPANGMTSNSTLAMQDDDCVRDIEVIE